MVDDVLVRVGELIFPADFYILDMEEGFSHGSAPIILGRPFLKTARTKIDVHAGTLSMEFDDIVVRFNILDAMKHPSEDHSVFHVDIIDDVVDGLISDFHSLHALKHSSMSELSEFACIGVDCDSYSDFNSDFDVDSDSLGVVPCDVDVIQSDCTNHVAGSTYASDCYIEVQSMEPISPSPMVPDIQPASNTPELKPLPNNLKYVYLEEEDKLFVIISTSLSAEQEQRLLRVLKKHKKAIGWTLADISGISPSTCMHRIFLEDGAKLVRQPQRRPNPLVSDVVKKEVTKLLQAGIIYPISDRQWVCPIHVVPKKTGLTMVKNEKEELIPTRVQNSWRVCIDYKMLNQETRKDHFPLPFIDQMLERLVGKSHYCCLDGFSGYFQIHIAPEDHEKTTFTRPFGTFAYRRMSFGLRN